MADKKEPKRPDNKGKFVVQLDYLIMEPTPKKEKQADDKTN